MSELVQEFLLQIKQRGALLAKGRLLGLQFSKLFKNGLFFKATRYSNVVAQKLSDAITAAGYTFASNTKQSDISNIAQYDVSKLTGKLRFLRLGKSG